MGGEGSGGVALPVWKQQGPLQEVLTAGPSLHAVSMEPALPCPCPLPRLPEMLQVGLTVRLQLDGSTHRLLPTGSSASTLSEAALDSLAGLWWFLHRRAPLSGRSLWTLHWLGVRLAPSHVHGEHMYQRGKATPSSPFNTH